MGHINLNEPKRPLRYVINVVTSTGYGAMGGPFMYLSQALSEIGNPGELIVRCNTNGSDDILFKWRNDKWLLISDKVTDDEITRKAVFANDSRADKPVQGGVVNDEFDDFDDDIPF